MLKPIHTLIFISLLIAAIWRVEVEAHGWESLTWLEYPHMAIPVGGAIFLAWIFYIARTSVFLPRILLVAFVWGTLASFILNFAASSFFVGGPTSILYAMYLGKLFEHMVWISPLIWGASILVLYAAYRWFFRFPRPIWIVGFGLWMGSWHLGLLMITVLPERGYHDLVHALKTGWMIPFCVIAVGLPLTYLSTDMPDGK